MQSHIKNLRTPILGFTFIQEHFKNIIGGLRQSISIFLAEIFR